MTELVEFFNNRIKHCRKSRKCCLTAFSAFPTMSSKALIFSTVCAQCYMVMVKEYTKTMHLTRTMHGCLSVCQAVGSSVGLSIGRSVSQSGNQLLINKSVENTQMLPTDIAQYVERRFVNIIFRVTTEYVGSSPPASQFKLLKVFQMRR